jgi:hypothetical protein
VFQELIYAILGPWGRAVIEWLLAHPAVLGSILAVWMGLMLWSQQSLRRVQNRTNALVLEGARKALAANPRLNSAQVYEQLYPEWCLMVRRSAMVVPHRWELWPLPATPSIVRDRIGFTPHWLWGHLVANGIRPAGAAPEPGKAAKSTRDAPQGKQRRKR